VTALAVAVVNAEHAPASVPDGFRSVSDAAARLGKSERQIRRDCERLEPLGLAVKVGGEWYISKSSGDPRLADYETREGRDLRQATELAKKGRSAKDIRQAEGKRDLVHRWADCTISGGDDESKARRFIAGCLTDGTLARLGVSKLKPRTLRAWEAAYKAEGLRGLIRQAYPERGETNFGEKAQRMLVEIMRVGHGISIRSAVDQVRGYIIQNHLENDSTWQLPAIRTCQAWWKDHVPRPAKILIAKGPHKLRALAIPKIRRDPTIDFAAGEVFIADERTLDCLCTEMGDRGLVRFRPKMTVWRDLVSGDILSAYTGRRANTDTLLATYREACVYAGTAPREIIIDNGPAEKSAAGPPRRYGKWDHRDERRERSVFGRMGTQVHFSTPRYPWAKPIESSFATLKEFDRFQASYFGGRPEERPFDAEAWSKKNIHELSTLDQIREQFAAWLKGYREQPRRSEGTEGYSPRQAFERFYTTRPRRVDRDTLDLLCRKLVGPVRIGRDGVRHQRMRYGTFDEAVWRMQGREVYMLVDPIERDSVILCQQDGTPICTANMDRPLGYKSEEIRERIAFQRRCEKTIRQYAPSRDYLLKTPAAQIAERRRLAAQARQVPDDALPPKPEPVSVELVRPDLAPAVERLKRAAGAETLRRLHGTDAAARAVNQRGRRYVDFAELAAKGEPAAEDESEKVRRRSVDWAAMVET